MSSVWIAIHGTGEDGDECRIEAVFDSEEKAEKHLLETFGKKWARFDANSVEEWEVQ